MNDSQLERIGRDMQALIKSCKFSELASKYAYPLAMGRDPLVAIKTDFYEALQECDGKFEDAKEVISVKRFEENSSSLKSLIECDFILENSTGILVELIVKVNDEVYLEQISSYRL